MDSYGLCVYESSSLDSIHFTNSSSSHLVFPPLRLVSLTIDSCTASLTPASSTMSPYCRNTHSRHLSSPYADMCTHVATMYSHYRSSVSHDMHVGLSKWLKNIGPTFDWFLEEEILNTWGTLVHNFGNSKGCWNEFYNTLAMYWKMWGLFGHTNLSIMSQLDALQRDKSHLQKTVVTLDDKIAKLEWLLRLVYSWLDMLGVYTRKLTTASGMQSPPPPFIHSNGECKPYTSTPWMLSIFFK